MAGGDIVNTAGGPYIKNLYGPYVAHDQVITLVEDRSVHLSHSNGNIVTTGDYNQVSQGEAPSLEGLLTIFQQIARAAAPIRAGFAEAEEERGAT